MIAGRPLFFLLIAAAVCGSHLSPANAHNPVLGRITSAPNTAQVGGAIRVTSTIKNLSATPQRVVVSVWLVRPWGEQVKLGESSVALRAGATQLVGVPGEIPRTVNPGPHSLGLVIGTQNGRVLADSRLIRILPPPRR